MQETPYAEVAAGLLVDAATFFGTIADENDALREQMIENSNVFRQVAALLRADPGRKLGDVAIASLGARLLRDAAGLFVTVGKQNEPLAEQMDANASVFMQVAALLEADPSGAIPGEDGVAAADLGADAASGGPTEPLASPFLETPVVARATVAPAERSIVHVHRAVAGKAHPQIRRSAPAGPPGSILSIRPASGEQIDKQPAVSPARASVPPKSEPPLQKRDPLSSEETRLNAHASRLDPSFGVSFPTRAVPDPITELWSSVAEAPLVAAVSRLADHVCRYCGFRSARYQRAIGRFSAVSASEAHCACGFCAQVMVLDRVAAARSGVLIHLPAIGQARLNMLLRVIYVCRISQGEKADIARRALDRLMARQGEAIRIAGSEKPIVLAQAFAAAQDLEEVEALRRRTKDLRLLPLDRLVRRENELEYNQFPQILAYWRSKNGPFGGLTVSQMDLGPFQQEVDDALRDSA